jgi:diphthine-ammonia ligase
MLKWVIPKNYIKTLIELKEENELQTAVFGDIDIEPNREWEEKVCNAAGIEALIPLWQRNRRELVVDMINSGMKAIIVSCNTQMGEEYLGRKIDFPLINELEDKGIDVCGENGEYHTLVVDCTLFSDPINLSTFSKKTYSDYCFIDWKIN